jgi:hypothetical protein
MANQTGACDTQFGGRIAFTIGGKRYSASDGDVKMRVSNREVVAESNSDGTVCRKVKIVTYKWDVTFRERSDIIWQESMKACSVDATAVEEDNGRTHLMTGGMFTGSPDYNTATGEITGVSIEGGDGAYQRV